MNTKYTVLAAALIGCGALSAPAQAQSQSVPEFKLSGFGTIAAAHSDDKNSDFIGSQLQPNGAGHTDSVSLAPDSKLGGQLDVSFSDKVSAVVQVVSQHQYDNSWTPQIEWANVKFKLTPELSLRAGRIATPSYLLSESRFVGYSMPWVRAPLEPYGVLAITSNDGVDTTWRTQVAGANNSVQAYYGQSKVKVGDSYAKSNPSWGINDTVEIGSLTLRAGYNSLTYEFGTTSLAGLFGGLASAGRTDLVEKYKLNGMVVTAAALGASYDPGNWFLMSEFVDFKGDGLLSDSRSWYVSGGYRIGVWTPYVTVSATKPHIVKEPGTGGLIGGINASLDSFTPEQNTKTIGVRWDFAKNFALKAQYDHITTGDNSNGRMKVYPGFVRGSSVNLATVALDFVF